MRSIQYPSTDDRMLQLSLANHTHSKADIGLSNVDNTSDESKPISIATQAVLANKANATHGHGKNDVAGLSAEMTDFDTRLSLLSGVTGTAISRPTVASIPNNVLKPAGTFTAQCTAFSMNPGYTDTLNSVRYQVSNNIDFTTTIKDVTVTVSPTNNIVLQSADFPSGTQYYFRVAYKGNSYNWSEWSAIYQFKFLLDALPTVKNTVTDYFNAATAVDTKTPATTWSGRITGYPAVGYGGSSDYVCRNIPSPGPSTPAETLPGSAWAPHTVTFTNPADVAVKVNVKTTSFMGICGAADMRIYSRGAPDVLLASYNMGTPPDYSIRNDVFTFVDTIPPKSSKTYQVLYVVTFNHGVDRDHYGAGLLELEVSHNSWVTT